MQVGGWIVKNSTINCYTPDRILYMMADKNDFSAVIAEILIELQQIRKDLKENDGNLREDLKKNNDSLQQTFNTGFTQMLEKMDEYIDEMKELRKDISKMAEFESRLQKLEETVFRKSA